MLYPFIYFTSKLDDGNIQNVAVRLDQVYNYYTDPNNPEETSICLTSDPDNELNVAQSFDRVKRIINDAIMSLNIDKTITD